MLEINRALFNEEIDSGLGTLKKIESKICTGTKESQENIALGDLLALEYTDRKELTTFLEKFKSLAKLAGYDEDNSLKNNLLIAKLAVDELFNSAIVGFKSLPHELRTTEKLIAIITETIETLKTNQHLNRNSKGMVAQMMLGQQSDLRKGIRRIARENTVR